MSTFRSGSSPCSSPGLPLRAGRHRGGEPDQQRFALGALAGATALGALLSGFAVRILSLRVVTLAGLLLCAATLWLMSGWTPAVSIGTVALVLGGFGLGFGLTVTPRS